MYCTYYIYGSLLPFEHKNVTKTTFDNLCVIWGSTQQIEFSGKKAIGVRTYISCICFSTLTRVSDTQ